MLEDKILKVLTAGNNDEWEATRAVGDMGFSQPIIDKYMEEYGLKNMKDLYFFMLCKKSLEEKEMKSTRPTMVKRINAMKKILKSSPVSRPVFAKAYHDVENHCYVVTNTHIMYIFDEGQIDLPENMVNDKGEIFPDYLSALPKGTPIASSTINKGEVKAAARIRKSVDKYKRFPILFGGKYVGLFNANYLSTLFDVFGGNEITVNLYQVPKHDLVLSPIAVYADGIKAIIAAVSCRNNEEKERFMEMVKKG